MATRSRPSASSRPESRSRRSDGATGARLVGVTVDLSDPPPLTAAQSAERIALDALPDAAIDTGDLPVLPDIATREAVRGKHVRPIKTSTTVRIDAILRREMLAALKKG